MVDFSLRSGRDKNTATVSEDGALLVDQSQAPALNGKNKIKPFVGYLTVNGDGVTNDLTVNGSSSSVECFIKSSTEGDLYITTANVVVAGVSVQLNRFGGISALTNGIDFFYSTKEERILVASGLKTNFDFLRISTLSKPTGAKNDAFQLANINAANNDGYNPILDLTRISPIGIRLKKSSSDSLGLIINDDLSTVATFNVLVLGFIRLG